MAKPPLTAKFLEAMAPAARDAWSRVRGLEPALARLLHDADAAWPSLAQPSERFLRFVANRIAAGAAPQDELLATLRAADLYLACAGAHQDARAIAAFRDHYLPDLKTALRHLGSSPAEVEEVGARVLELLFVGNRGGPPKIGNYSGLGSLRGWARSFAVRTARKMRHPAGLKGEDALLEALPAAIDDPEMDHLRARYGDDFRRAFEEAANALSERERTLLKHHAVDGLSIDRIGTLYRVHRATAARWLSAARQELLVQTRGRLAKRLGLPDSELDSIIRLLGSRLHVSVSRVLGRSSK